MASFLTDPALSTAPRLIALIPFNDGDGSSTGGVSFACRNINNFLANGNTIGHNVKIGISGGAGTFTISGETITEATSGATGTYLCDDGSFMYLTKLNGIAFGSAGAGKTLTGGTSGATRTAGTITTPAANVAPYSLDNLIAAGWRYACMFWAFGQKASGQDATAGAYPLDYPSSAAGLAAVCTPLNQTQNETAFGGTSYTAQFGTALNTAGRKGSMYGLYFYSGAAHAGSAVDTSSLDNFSAAAENLGATPMYDVQSVVEYANRAPPQLMESNLLGWWEADHLCYSDAGSTAATNNGVVAQWNSIYGSAVFSQATGGKQPTYKTNQVNGYPAIDPGSANSTNYMTLASAIGGSSFTIVAVVNVTASTGQGLLGKSGDGTQLVYFNETTAGTLSILAGVPYVHTTVSHFSTGAWHILRYRCDHVNCKLYVDGTELSDYASAEGGGGSSAFTGTPSLDQLFRYNAGASGFWGKSMVAALAICNASATDNQIQLIEAYWANKYGLTVAGSPSLPHKAHVDRLYSARGVKVIREGWDLRTVTGLQGWNTNGGGMSGVGTQLDSALAAPTSYYTKATINGRASVILTASLSVSDRITAISHYMGLGYDVIVDPGGFSAAQVSAAVATANSYASGAFGFPFRGTRSPSGHERA